VYFGAKVGRVTHAIHLEGEMAIDSKERDKVYNLPSAWHYEDSLKDLFAGGGDDDLTSRRRASQCKGILCGSKQGDLFLSNGAKV
jgi:hypothetical protein